MDRQLSSFMVPIFKWIPFILIIPAISELISDPAKIFPQGIIFLAIFPGIWLAVTFRWKRVKLKSGRIVIAGYFRKIEVSVEDIELIYGSNFWSHSPQTVTLYLKTRTRFGDRITFVPKGGWSGAERWAANLSQELGVR